MSISIEDIMFVWVFFFWPVRQGVLSILVFFFWQVLLGGLYLLWRKWSVSMKGRFLLVSVAAGYGVMAIGYLLETVLILDAFRRIVISAEHMGIITTVAIATLLLLPVGTTHYIARRTS